MTRLESFRAWRARRRLRQRSSPINEGGAAHPAPLRLSADRGAERRRSTSGWRISARRCAGRSRWSPRPRRSSELLDGELAFAKKSAARQYVESIGAVVFVALCLRSFVVEAYQIPSGSMIPTLEIGDHIFVNKLVYGVRIPFTDIKFATHFRQPRRGEIIVFSHPVSRDEDLIKRVVAVGGDEVEVRDNVVYVNGVATAHKDKGARHYFDFDETTNQWVERDAEAFREHMGQAEFTTLQDPTLPPRGFGPVRVPAGKLFVMGDNRDNSSDSRYWGFVPLNLVRGRAMVVWWSLGQPEGIRFGRFGHLLE